MGIKGLWQVSEKHFFSTFEFAQDSFQHLPETAKDESLMELAVKRGFEANLQGLRAYRIGIDVSLWFFHAQKVAGQTNNGELQMFFYRCCR